MFRLFSMPSYSCVLGSFQKLLCFFPQMKKPSHSSQKNLNQNADLGYFDPEKFSPPRTKKEPNRLKWLQIDWKGAKIVVVPKLPFFFGGIFLRNLVVPPPPLCKQLFCRKISCGFGGYPPPPFTENIARIAKAALHNLSGKSSLNVGSVCPVCPGFLSVPDDYDDHETLDNHDDRDDHDYNDVKTLMCIANLMTT